MKRIAILWAENLYETPTDVSSQQAQSFLSILDKVAINKPVHALVAVMALDRLFLSLRHMSGDVLLEHSRAL